MTYGIHEMPYQLDGPYPCGTGILRPEFPLRTVAPLKDYFRYLPASSRTRIWGCEVSAIGHTRIAAGAPYPPARHPDDHHFNWERGRVLQNLQIVFISKGTGVLESARAGAAHAIRAGEVFLLFPGVWHRFAPAPATGWTEHWVECSGPAFAAALAAETLTPQRPVIAPGDPAEVLQLFARLHTLAAKTGTTDHDAAATLALHLFARLAEMTARPAGRSSSLRDRLEHARRLLTETCDQPFDAPATAAAVGLGGSHFRQAFRRECGIAPRAFHAEARLRRAADLLANTSLSSKEIADLLGFSSAFHFSHAFKRGRGLSPTHWRNRQVVGRPFRGLLPTTSSD
jgi:AraC-like DNA-binding protein